MAADRINAKSSDAKFKPHEEGQFVAQCVDCIDLGEVVQDFPGSPKYLAQKCALVFRTGCMNEETGEPIDIAQEFTVTMGEKANLRKFLEQWRGRAYTQEQIDAGVPLDKLVGQWALLTVSHKKSQKGRTYGLIQSAVPVPKQMEDRPEVLPYTRAAYWGEKKQGYAALARTYRTEIGAPNGVTEDDGPPPEDTNDAEEYDSDDDSLPFNLALHRSVVGVGLNQSPDEVVAFARYANTACETCLYDVCRYAAYLDSREWFSGDVDIQGEADSACSQAHPLRWHPEDRNHRYQDA